MRSCSSGRRLRGCGWSDLDELSGVVVGHGRAAFDAAYGLRGHAYGVGQGFLGEAGPCSGGSHGLGDVHACAWAPAVAGASARGAGGLRTAACFVVAGVEGLPCDVLPRVVNGEAAEVLPKHEVVGVLCPPVALHGG